MYQPINPTVCQDGETIILLPLWCKTPHGTDLQDTHNLTNPHVHIQQATDFPQGGVIVRPVLHMNAWAPVRDGRNGSVNLQMKTFGMFPPISKGNHFYCSLTCSQWAPELMILHVYSCCFVCVWGFTWTLVPFVTSCNLQCSAACGCRRQNVTSFLIINELASKFIFLGHLASVTPTPTNIFYGGLSCSVGLYQ